MSAAIRSPAALPRPETIAESFRFYWRLAVKPFPKNMLVILGLMTGCAIFDALTITLTVPLIDVLTSQGRAPGRPQRIVADALRAVGIEPTVPTIVFALLAVTSVLFVARSALFVWNHHCTAAVAVRLRARMRVSLFDRFLHARYDAMATRSRGVVIQDMNVAAEALCGTVVNLGFLLTNLVNGALMIGLLVCMSWWVTAAIAVVAACGVLGWRRYADRRSVAQGKRLYDLRAEEARVEIDAIDGLRVVKAHGIEDRLVAHTAALLHEEEAPELKISFLRNAPSMVNELVASVIVLGLGAVTLLMPWLGIRFSMLAAFLLGIRKIAPALGAVNQASVGLARDRRNLEIIDEVLRDLPQEPTSGEPVGRITDVRLDGVGFAYSSRTDHAVLTDVTAALRRGTITALVGPTGSGKSTIASLLLGLYTPQTGAVLINGTDLRRLRLFDWRSRVGYVSQDVFVFNTTVRENITLGDESVTPAQMEAAARTAQLHEFIASLPDGYDTTVGDRGLRLSGGQCQRLAIARAILRRPEVLIFDEATSALDNLTERAVYEAIGSLSHNAVVVVIAHRLSTIREADQILVLESGRVTEAGRHDALVARRGTYAKLYEEDDRTASRPDGDAAIAEGASTPLVESPG